MKNRFFRISLIFCLIVGTFWMMPVKGEAKKGTSRQVIKVGFYQLDGYHMIDADGNRSGYGYDFLRLVARYLDVDYEYVGYEKSWEETQEMLAEGKMDLVTSARKTPEREKLFDFSKPIGTTMAIMTIKNGNASIVPRDYSTYDGIRVALLRDHTRNEDFAKFAHENGFTYEPVYYSMTSEMEEALQKEEVDAIVTGSLRYIKNEQVIEEFDYSEFYAMVKKGNTKLLEQINYAIDQLNAVEGDWKNTLANKYYDQLDSRNLALTDHEKAVIDQYVTGEKTLVVTANTDRRPYSYEENGELKGIIPDYFRLLADSVGLPYEFAVPSDRAQYQKWQTDGTVDLFIDARIATENQVEAYGSAVTVPYITMQLAMVTRRDFDGNIRKIAVAKNQGTYGIEDQFEKNAERIYVNTREEGMQAVLDGEVDATFVYLYTAQEFVNQDERGLLTYTMIKDPSYTYRMILMKSAPHELAGILTKAIYSMPSVTIEMIASQYTNYKAQDMDLHTWVKIHPFTGLTAATVLFLMCLFAVLLYERQKTIKLEIERSAQLKKLAEEAETASRAKTDFLANMSHDIRTPMNAIVGIAGLMEHEPEITAGMRSYIQKIRISSEHLLSLINDVLDMSRIEANEVILNIEDFRLSEQIEQIRSIISFQTNEREQCFLVSSHEICHDSLKGDGMRLRQVFLNLLSNAAKYTQKGGNVWFDYRELSCEAPGYARFEFVVQDNGCGMDREFLEHIYEPFVRNEASVTNKIQGTGLGMAITKNLVSLMEGDIHVESEPGKGSRFTVTLTFPVAEENNETAAQDEEDSSILKGMKFLCAEDNSLNTEILRAFLELHEASCEIYPDGAELVKAFKTVEEGSCDAILMDIQMPNMNGYEAAKEIRNSENPLGKTIPIIAMTANVFEEDIKKSLEAGMDAHISKPIDQILLEETLKRLTNRQ